MKKWIAPALVFATGYIAAGVVGAVLLYLVWSSVTWGFRYERHRRQVRDESRARLAARVRRPGREPVGY